MSLCKAAYCQRPHAVAEKKDPAAFEKLGNVSVYSPHVINHSLPSSGVHVSKVVGTFHRCPVTPVIMNDACISVVAEKFHEGNIPLLVFAHPVYELYHSLW